MKVKISMVLSDGTTAEQVADLDDEDPMAQLLARPVTASITHVDLYGGRFRYQRADA